MPVNFHADIRYRALDKCFSNHYRNFYIEDLIVACNQALYNYTGNEKFNIDKKDIMEGSNTGIKLRQIRKDLSYMRSEAGGGADIIVLRDENNKCYYRYSDRSFSIYKQDLSDDELKQLRQTVITLKRFKGLPSFEWIEDLLTRLECKFQLSGNTTDSVVGFEQNPYYEGLGLLSPIIDYIVNKQVVTIMYKAYGKDAEQWTIHPYYVKQYNNRWFLIGHNVGQDRLSTIPFDRICKIESIPSVSYKPYEGMDFDELYSDVVGVTIKHNKPVESVLLRFSSHRFPYVVTKPLHESQRCVDKENRIIRIDVIPNPELEALILSYGNDVEVLAPEHLREQIKKKIEDLAKIYLGVHKECTEQGKSLHR